MEPGTTDRLLRYYYIQVTRCGYHMLAGLVAGREVGRPYVHASDTYILATLNTVCHASPPVTYPPPILLCRNVFFCTSAFLSLPAPGLFSCSRLRGTQGARRNNEAQVWALAKVRGMCSGDSKSKVNTGRPSEHVEPSRSMQTHVQVNKMSDRSCDI